MIVGYARTSTVEQVAGFAAQVRDLEAAGCERIFSEQVSSVAQRDRLNEAMAFVREGDALVVTKLDRLARSVADLMRIVDALKAKKVALRILGIGVDTGTPTGKMLLQMLGAVAEFERGIMLERQREGIAKAKSEGRFKGRAPTARAKAPEIIALAEQGMSKERIAKQVGVGIASVYRALAADRPRVA